MTHEFEVSAEELLRTLQLRGIQLPSEIAAFITLEVCEGLIARPAAITTRELRINENGGVLFPEAPRAVSEQMAVDSLLGLLSDLLVCAGPAVPHMMVSLVEPGGQAAQGHGRSLAALASELAACLVPLNRGATRRVMARLVREARKPGAGSVAPSAMQPSAAELDAQLDSLLSAPPSITAPVLELSRLREPSVIVQPQDLHEPARSLAPVQQLSVRRPRERPRFERDLLVEAQTTRANVGVWIFGCSTLAAIGLLCLYFTFGQKDAASALGRIPQPTAAAAVADPSAKPTSDRRYGDLIVQVAPARVQVLLLIGVGPAVATDLPLGVTHEFVALAESYAPARALVPADATWDETEPGGKGSRQPRYELAIQASPLRDGAPTRTLGPSLMPRDVGAPSGRLGSVRVVTSPRGAAVYQLIGFAPEARVENLELDRTYEVLVYLEGRQPVSQRVKPDAFVERDGKRIARLDFDL